MKILLVLIVSILCLGSKVYSQNLPDGFSDEVVYRIGGLIGVDFVNDSTTYIWRKNGEVVVFVNDELSSKPLLDLKEEVVTYSDQGLLGFARHPDFLNNGYVYVYYVADPHHVKYFGTENYLKDSTENYVATIGRLTRYQVDLSSLTEVVEGSRKVLIGEDFTSGVPSLTASHMGGTILFGSDTTLLLATGDGNSFDKIHAGGQPFPTGLGFDSTGLAYGVIDHVQDIGAFRSQSLASLNGKILRIDPITGRGISSNPFYEDEEPNSNKSKVYALGFRNPFRMTINTSTGSTDRSDGNVGDIYS